MEQEVPEIEPDWRNVPLITVIWLLSKDCNKLKNENKALFNSKKDQGGQKGQIVSILDKKQDSNRESKANSEK